MTGLISSKEEFIFALKTQTPQQALVKSRPGDHSEVDWEVNLGEISFKITDARLILKYECLEQFQKRIFTLFEKNFSFTFRIVKKMEIAKKMT